MKTLKKILYGVLILLIIAVITCLIFIRHISHKGLPEYSGSLELKSIKEEVTIIRDEYGIPHNGPDKLENMICVCPNCHVLLDFGVIRLNQS